MILDLADEFNDTIAELLRRLRAEHKPERGLICARALITAATAFDRYTQTLERRQPRKEADA